MQRLIGAFVFLSGVMLAGVSPALAQSDPVEAGRARFNVRCAACHGQDGMGGERAPAIGKGQQQGLDDDKTLRNLVRNGVPDRGMPAFGSLPAGEFEQLVAFSRSRILPLSRTTVSGSAQRGAALFFANGSCADCHMVWGRGNFNAPDLTEAASKLTLAQIETAMRKPAVRPGSGWQLANIRTRDGQFLRGFIRNESAADLQLHGLDNNLHLLSKRDVVSIERDTKPAMPAFTGSPAAMSDLLAFLKQPPRSSVPLRKIGQPWQPRIDWKDIVTPSANNWPSYNGQIGGNRYSTLNQITPANVKSLAPAWMFAVPGQGSGQPLEVTPVAANGVMYVTRVNAVFALDAKSGRLIWQYVRPPSKGLVGDAASGLNRGVAVLGDRVFVVTDNAHLLALHRINGALLWDTVMEDPRKHYGATSAPLAVGNLVISGLSGGDEGIRGQLNAYNAETGAHVWRFWTIPDVKNRPKNDWIGRALEHGCGAAWLTGTYDAGTDSVIWPIGNPCPDYNGDERKGDNLYTDSVVALDTRTGKLKWHFQFTPHDLHDWDATEVPMLVDADYKGAPRKLLLQGNRNGYFYVLDRITGQFLSATPFVKKLTWAKGVDAKGRPILAEGWQPTEEGTQICPAVEGATNWMSPAYHPGTRLFYLQALEKCNVFTKNGEWWKQGESFYGGTARRIDSETPRKFVRALDPSTGKIVWEHEQHGGGNSWGGIVATAGGLLFYCDDDGSFGALDAKTGKLLWTVPLAARWHSSPMTYAVDGKQYVAVAVNSGVMAFGLVP